MEKLILTMGLEGGTHICILASLGDQILICWILSHHKAAMPGPPSLMDLMDLLLQRCTLHVHVPKILSVQITAMGALGAQLVDRILACISFKT